MLSRTHLFTRRGAGKTTGSRWRRARRAEAALLPPRRPTVSTCELERLYNYGTLLRLR